MATDKAKKALSMRPDASLGVGMEWGLEDVGVTSNLVCVVVFWNRKEVIVAQSGRILLPQVVSEGVKQGGSYGKLLQEYRKTAPPEESARITDLTGQELPYIHAIRKALPQVKDQVKLSWKLLFLTMLAPRYKAVIFLKITALLAFVYFIGKAIVAVVWDIAFIFETESIWNMFAQLNIIAPLFLGSWLVSLLLLCRPNYLQKHPNARLGLQLCIVTTSLVLGMSLIICWLSWPGVISDKGWEWLDQYALTLTFYGVIIAICFIAAHLYLFRTWWKSEAVSTSTIGLLVIGLVCIPASWLPLLPWLSYATMIFTPVMVVGVSWCYGTWRLSQDILDLDASRYDKDFAKPPPIISPYLPEQV